MKKIKREDLYPLELLRLLYQETVWPSPIPDKPSRGWNAESIRLLMVGVFEHATSRKCIVAANTRLDNARSRNRLESVAITLKILRRIHSTWIIGGDGGGGTLGNFLAGAFDLSPTQEAYLAIEGSG